MNARSVYNTTIERRLLVAQEDHKSDNRIYYGDIYRVGCGRKDFLVLVYIHLLTENYVNK
jgi:hypothetical protein